MISQTWYKNRPAVCVRSANLEALFLPQDGGKMVSLKDTEGNEYLEQAPGAEYLPLAYNGSYIEAECSSFDDMFPTIDPWAPSEGEFAGVEYPDHGEVCRMPAEFRFDGETLCMRSASRQFKTVFSKRIRAEEDGSIVVDYRIENNGKDDFAFLWAAHCMFKGEDGAEAMVSYPDDAPMNLRFGNPELLGCRKMDYASGEAYKFFYSEKIAEPEGYVAVKYPSTGKAIWLKFDADKIPYIALWMNNGEFKGMHNIAAECITSPKDIPDASCPKIPAGGAYTFTIRFEVKKA